jgi:two-component system OmpR family response regulator
MRVLYAAIPPRDGYLARALAEAGHVVEAADGVADVVFAATQPFDAILLDGERLEEPLIRRIAAVARGSSLLLVVDHATAMERTRALQAGADACFVRPVPFIELEARLSALMRLGHSEEVVGGLTLDAARRIVRVDGRELMLPMREFAVLDYLHGHRGEVVQPTQLLESVWREAEDASPERLRSTLTRLRSRLSASFGAPLIETVRGHGYRLQPNMKQSSSR